MLIIEVVVIQFTTGFMQFLTMCGLVATTVSMGLALLLDLVQGPEGKCKSSRVAHPSHNYKRD